MSISSSYWNFAYGQESFSRTAQDTMAVQTIQEKYNKLAETAFRDGRVRIIVELDTDFQPEGKLRFEQEKMDQRGRIKGIQNSVMQTLPTDGVISHYDFKYIPYTAITVNNAALDQLLSSPLVKSFHEDRLELPLLSSSTPLIGATTAHSGGFTGSGQIVAIMDSGVATHSFIGDFRIVSEACYSFESFIPGVTGPETSL